MDSQTHDRKSVMRVTGSSSSDIVWSAFTRSFNV